MTPLKEFEPARAASPTPFLLTAPTAPSNSVAPSWRVDYGSYATQGRRDAMEDAHSITEDDRYFMWALFDGYVAFYMRAVHLTAAGAGFQSSLKCAGELMLFKVLFPLKEIILKVTME